MQRIGVSFDTAKNANDFVTKPSSRKTMCSILDLAKGFPLLFLNTVIKVVKIQRLNRRNPHNPIGIESTRKVFYYTRLNVDSYIPKPKHCGKRGKLNYAKQRREGVCKASKVQHAMKQMRIRNAFYGEALTIFRTDNSRQPQIQWNSSFNPLFVGKQCSGEAKILLE